MRIDLQNRILRVAATMKTADDHAKFVQEMRSISDTLTKTSADMKQALKTRNISLLSTSITENKKAADDMACILSKLPKENP
jgi:negative regulator of replication initiation